jgi:hypothetical protein
MTDQSAKISKSPNSQSHESMKGKSKKSIGIFCVLMSLCEKKKGSESVKSVAKY